MEINLKIYYYNSHWTKNRALQVPPVVPYKALESFPRLCVGQREVLAAHDFSVLLWFNR